MGTQLTSQGKALQDSQDQVGRLRQDLRKAKETSKTASGGEGRGLGERLAGLERSLHQAEEEKTTLQVYILCITVHVHQRGL